MWAILWFRLIRWHPCVLHKVWSQEKKWHPDRPPPTSAELAVLWVGWLDWHVLSTWTFPHKRTPLLSNGTETPHSLFCSPQTHNLLFRWVGEIDQSQLGPGLPPPPLYYLKNMHMSNIWSGDVTSATGQSFLLPVNTVTHICCYTVPCIKIHPLEPFHIL